VSNAAHRRGQPEDPAQLAAHSRDGRRDAAEVLVELLAVDGVAVLAHPLELRDRLLEVRDRAGV
jgi:hypothetical protein